MRRLNNTFRIWTAVVLLTLSLCMPARVVAQALPATKLVTAPLLAPTTEPGGAWNYYNTQPLTHSTGALAWNSTTRPPEIKELARALGAARYSASGYTNAVYEYVRNNIAIEFRFGLSKGARGAIIDQSGTAFDQAHLMIELLREGRRVANYNLTADYIVGTVSLTAGQFGKWTGLVNGLNENLQTFSVNQRAACQFLADGGFPATVSTSTECPNLTGNLPSGTATPVVMGHIWVRVTADATTSYYDPAFKTHTLWAGTNLASAIACTAPNPSCGESVIAPVPAVSVLSGTGVGDVPAVTYVQGSSAVNGAVRNQLATFGIALQNYVQAGSAANQATMAITSLIGGRDIVADAVYTAGSSLPLTNTTQYTWADPADIPDAFRSTLRVQFESIDQSLWVDELYGKRLRMVAGAAPADPFRGTALYAEYRPLARSNVSYPTISIVNTLELSAGHPYAANGGSYGDESIAQSFDLLLQTCALPCNLPSSTLTWGVVTILHGWGDSSPSTQNHFSALAIRDETNMTPENPSDPNHIWKVSRTERGSDTGCNHAVTVPSNSVPDTRCFEQQGSIVASNLLAQMSRVNAVGAGVNQALIQSHHNLGFLLSWPEGNSSAGTLVSVQSSISGTSTTSSASDRTALFHVLSSLHARLEGGVFEQIADQFEGGSSVSLLEKSFDKGKKFFEVTGVGSAVDNVEAALSRTFNYEEFSKNVIRSYANNGFSVIFPEDRSVGSYSVANTFITYGASGIGAFSTSGDRIAHVVGDFLKGATAGGTVGTGALDVVADAAQQTKVRDRSSKLRQHSGVNPANGELTLSPPPDIVSGAGDFPASIPFQRFYVSSTVAPGYCDRSSGTSRSCTGPNEVGLVRAGTPTDIGGGWYHNLEIEAKPGSDAMAGFGRDSALASAGLVAALHSLREIASGTQSLRSRIAVVIATDWIADLLQDNVVSVQVPPKSFQFVRLLDDNPADGLSFASVAGTKERLFQFGTRSIWMFHDLHVHWNTTAVSYALTAGDSSVIALSYRPPTSSPSEEYWDPRGERRRPSSWEFPSGVRLDFTYDSGGCLKQVTNNLGRELSFSCGSEFADSFWVRDESNRQVTITSNLVDNGLSLFNPPTYPATHPQIDWLRVQSPDGGVSQYDYLSIPVGASERPHSRIYRWFTPGSSTPVATVEYDSLYRVKAVNDSASPSNRTEYFVSAKYGEDNWKRGEQKNALGGLTTQYFDRYGSLRISIDALNRATWHQYDTARRLTRTTLPEGNVISYTYDARHNKLTETVSPKTGSALLTNTMTYTYGEGPTVATCVNPATCNQVKTVQDPKGNVSTFDYLNNGLLQRAMGPAVALVTGGVAGSSQVDYCYGSFGLLAASITKVDGATHRVKSFAYDSANKYVLQSAVTDPSNTYVAPALGSPCAAPTNKPGALNLATTFGFDGVGNVQSIDGPRPGTGDRTDYLFDSTRRLTTISAPLNALTRYCYDADGLLVSTNRARSATTDPYATTAITTGQCGDGSSFTAGTWQSEKRSYFATGDLKSVKDAENNETQYAYDAVGRQRVVQDPNGRQTATVYDLAGQTVAAWKGGSTWINADGTLNTAAFGSGGVPISTTPWTPPASYASGPMRYSASTYSNNGKLLSILDANNNQTDYQYDRHDRLWFTFFPHPTSGARCTQNATEMTTTTVLNPTCATGQTYERLWYTANGQTSGTRCSGDPSASCRLRNRRNQVIDYTYDAMNRLSTKAPASQGTVTYAYNLASDPLQMSEAAATNQAAYFTNYSYDAAGRKLTESYKVNANGTPRTVSYQYDTLATAGDMAGQKTKTIWPDNFYVSYEYDALNRMTRVRENSTSSGELAYYEYDPLSRRTLLCLGGQSGSCAGGGGTNKTTYSYEPDSGLDVLSQYLGSTSPAVALDYGHNASGQITSIAATDDFYLSSRPSATVSRAYTPDKLNRYGSLNLSGTAHTPTYDNSGNLLTWRSPTKSNRVQTYTFDSENRLASALDNSITTRYDYDALGRRVKKTVGSAITEYLLDGDEEIAEYSSAGVLQHRYITGPGVDDRIAHIKYLSGTGYKTFYHANHQGSVIAMTDAAGALSGCALNVDCQRYAYDEYGKLTSATPTVPTTGEVFRYTGRRYDDESGLYYYRARYYSPDIGRFLQVDPIGYRDDNNLYVYVGNDPANKTDPTGLAVLELGLELELIPGGGVKLSGSVSFDTQTLEIGAKGMFGIGGGLSAGAGLIASVSSSSTESAQSTTTTSTSIEFSGNMGLAGISKEVPVIENGESVLPQSGSTSGSVTRKVRTPQFERYIKPQYKVGASATVNYSAAKSSAVVARAVDNVRRAVNAAVDRAVQKFVCPTDTGRGNCGY